MSPQPQKPATREGSADALEEYLLNLTRRRFFGSVAGSLGAGLGGVALAQMMGSRAASAAPIAPNAQSVIANLPHYAPKAKRVIYMHMEGAPSQLDLYDYKPNLVDQFNKELPSSVRNGQRITTMTSDKFTF